MNCGSRGDCFSARQKRLRLVAPVSVIAKHNETSHGFVLFVNSRRFHGLREFGGGFCLKRGIRRGDDFHRDFSLGF